MSNNIKGVPLGLMHRPRRGDVLVCKRSPHIKYVIIKHAYYLRPGDELSEIDSDGHIKEIKLSENGYYSNDYWDVVIIDGDEYSYTALSLANRPVFTRLYIDSRLDINYEDRFDE